MEGDGDDTPVDGLGHYLHEGASLRCGEEDKDFDLRYNKLELLIKRYNWIPNIWVWNLGRTVANK